MPDPDALRAQYDALAESFTGLPDVAIPAETGRRGFGSDALTVHGRIFAMLARGHLVVKLPAARVAALTEQGTGTPFTAGKATPMREWLVVARHDRQTWRDLAREAHAHVSSHPGRRQRSR